MTRRWDIGLAKAEEAAAIAALARDEIEHGLGWSWTAERVRSQVEDVDTNVLVARERGTVVGFALLQYRERDAHLLLLGVHPQRRRRGIASALLCWLEATLRVAGIARVQVEARAGNEAALAFYRRAGFVETGRLPRYYRGREDAIQLCRLLPAV